LCIKITKDSRPGQGGHIGWTRSKEGFELEFQIEELEPKLALNGGETVLPLGLLHIPGGIHHKHP